MATQADNRELDLQEQLARIRKHMTEIDEAQADVYKLNVDTGIAPWQAAIGGMTAGAALLAAGAAITKIWL